MSNKWIKPEDVRTPVTVKEGEAALDLIDAAMDSLESTITHREQTEPQPGLRKLLRVWENKRAEVAYAIERIEAGETPASIEIAKLRAQVADLERQNADVRRERDSARALLRNAETSGPSAAGLVRQNADLMSQNAALVKKNAGLAEALRTVRPVPPLPPPDDVKRALKKSVHDAFAFGAEALDDLVAAGVTLTPLADLFLDHCNNSVPAGYRIEWRAKDGSFKRAAADARAQRIAS